jgi:HJR/Mrr/RecB family endonuclease
MRSVRPPRRAYYQRGPLFRGKYIVANERLGSEFSESRTYFYYSPDTRKKCQGVAGIVRQSLEVLVVNNLPDIEAIDLATIDMTKRKTTQVKEVLRYMDEGHIRDFETLKRLHRRARHFYGNILTDKVGDPKGVLVIDDTGAQSPFTEATVAKLGFYTKLLSSAI